MPNIVVVLKKKKACRLPPQVLIALHTLAREGAFTKTGTFQTSGTD